MGLSRSLSVGTSSLKAHQQKFDVISNNLANASTVGYKSNRANFEEQFNQIYTRGRKPAESGGVGAGGRNPLQMGLGVKLGSIQQNMQQGVIETTERPLDLALAGNGFFVYNLNGAEKYSRAGTISHDKGGNFVDSNTGAFLQGWNVAVDATGRIQRDSIGDTVLNGKMENLKISKDIVSPPKQTSLVTLRGNLNSNMVVGDTRRTSINIFDNIGAVHTLEVLFSKTATANQFTLSGTIDGRNIAIPAALQTVTFNADGTLNAPTSLTISSTDLNTLLGANVFNTANNLTIELAPTNQLLSGITQYSMPSSASFATQNGFKMGTLEDLTVDDKGNIWGAFTNGQSEVLGRVALAQFQNQEGLVRDGANMFIPSPNSGYAQIGSAGDIFPSTTVKAGALEQSNVDIATQFTDMISTQRAFEAASRTITVSDTLLAEINNLKR